MKKEKVKTEEEAHTNPLLGMPVVSDSELKDYLVQYVGTKLDHEEVTVNMIAEILAVEFPEFMYAIAEENYLRGYQVGLDDADRLFNEYAEKLSRTTE
jgi:hypothetical protein|tara:strand:- start:909 stop:1202 length:294 start_codon:yes stop_codon:yes gene_type:complete